MALKKRTDDYWNTRAVARLTDAEKALDPHAKAVQRIYARAEKQVTADINQIYRTYAKSTGVDVDALLKKLSIEDTHAFWLKMKSDGHLAYITANYDSRISRLEQLKGELYSTVKKIADEENGVHTDAHIQTINDTYNKNIFDTSQGLNTNIAFGGLNQQVFDTMLNSPWLGANYSQRVWGNTDVLATSIKDQLGSALLTGKSSRSLSGDLQEQFGVAKYVADRLLRTETNYYQNEADAQSSEDIGLDKYIYVATLDSRTSFVCRAEDHQVFLYKDRIVGDNYPPLHPNCRSTTRSYIGAEYEPKTRMARDEDGQPVMVKNQSYEQWAQSNGVVTIKPTKPPVPTPPTKKVATVTKTGAVKNVTQEVVNDIGVPIKYGRKLDPQIKDVLTEGISDVHKRYPQAFTNLQEIDIAHTTSERSVKRGHLLHGAYIKKATPMRDVDGYHSLKDADGKTIFKANIGGSYNLKIIVPQSENTMATHVAEINKQHKNGWWSNNNPKSTIYHELGHSLEVAMNMKTHNLYEDFAYLGKHGGMQVRMTPDLERVARSLSRGMSDHRIGDSIVLGAIDDIKSPDSYFRTIKDQVSEYGTKSKTGYREGFAEMFSKYMSGAKDPLTKAFGKRLDSKLKELEL